MEAGTRQKMSLITLALVLLVLVRVGLIWKQRHEAEQIKPAAQAQSTTPKDAYVVLPKLYAYDLASAKQGLDGKTIWVAAGNRVKYYVVRGGAVDWKHAASTLSPLDTLKVVDVRKVDGPVENIKSGDVVFHKTTPEVVAIFTRGDKPERYATRIGTVEGDSYTFVVDNTFYIEDPHQLYKHWPADIWKAIDEHRAVQGMNELQASMALGPGSSEDRSNYGNRTMQYEFGGKTYSVSFSQDRATSVQPQ
jgi:hypothetical protein